MQQQGQVIGLGSTDRLTLTLSARVAAAPGVLPVPHSDTPRTCRLPQFPAFGGRPAVIMCTHSLPRTHAHTHYHAHMHTLITTHTCIPPSPRTHAHTHHRAHMHPPITAHTCTHSLPRTHAHTHHHAHMHTPITAHTCTHSLPRTHAPPITTASAFPDSPSHRHGPSPHDCSDQGVRGWHRHHRHHSHARARSTPEGRCTLSARTTAANWVWATPSTVPSGCWLTDCRAPAKMRYTKSLRARQPVGPPRTH